MCVCVCVCVCVCLCVLLLLGLLQYKCPHTTISKEFSLVAIGCDALFAIFILFFSWRSMHRPEFNGLFHKAVLSLCKSGMTRALVIDARNLNLFPPHICA
jgi:hypothetical protein